jgi:hypothetical protein
VEVQSEEIEVAVRFELAHRRTITFTQERLSNMSPRSEVHTRFAHEDSRIPPYACHEHEDIRPHYDNTRLIFHPKNGIDIPNTLSNGGGAAGGTNANGKVLPPVAFPVAPIDITGGSKVQGALKGMPGPRDDSCATDSSEDEEGEDTHKLCKIAQAIHKGQPLTIVIRGQLEGIGGKVSEVLFQRDTRSTGTERHLNAPARGTPGDFRTECDILGSLYRLKRAIGHLSGETWKRSSRNVRHERRHGTDY